MKLIVDIVPWLALVAGLAVALFYGAKAWKGPARLRVGFRNDGYIDAEDQEGVRLIFGEIEVDRVGAVLVGVVNAGGARINDKATEEDVTVRLFSSPGSEPLRLLDVDSEHGTLTDEHTLRLEVERMHPLDRRVIRLQYEGDPSPHVEVSGEITDLGAPIERYHRFGRLGAHSMQISLAAFLALMLAVGVFWDVGPVRWRSSVDIPAESISSIETASGIDLGELDGDLELTEAEDEVETALAILGLLLLFLLFGSDLVLPRIRTVTYRLGWSRPPPFETSSSKDF